MEPPDDGDRRIRVGSAHAGQRLDKFLVERFPRWSRKKLAEVVRTGHIRVNGRRGRPGTLLAAGDVLTVPPMGQEVDRVHTERVQARHLGRAPRDVREVFRDDDLLVVDKPPGVPMHGGANLGAVRTLLEILRKDIVAGFGLVHRLDRDTSGLVALVRGAELRALTARRFAEEESGPGAAEGGSGPEEEGAAPVRKTYEAIVRGVPEQSEGEVDLPLSPPVHRGRAKVDERRGKPARTRYRVLESFGDYARLTVEPVTGRTHQIRVHLAAIGHPLVVDPLYGDCSGWRLPDPRGKADARLRRTPLHAVGLSLPHPRTGEALTFHAPLPSDMKYALEVLRVIAGRRRGGGGRETPPTSKYADDAPGGDPPAGPSP